MSDKIINKWDADVYSKDGRYVSELAGKIFDWLDPKKGEKILDIGCGDGSFTQKIAQNGANVLGIDLSESMINKTKSLGLEAYQLNAENFDLNTKFDKIFSNAAFHWFPNPQKAIERVAHHLKKDGQFICEFGGHGNIAAIMVAIRVIAKKYHIDPSLTNPFFNPTCNELDEMLKKEGLKAIKLELASRPTLLPAGMKGWLNLFRNKFLDEFEGDKRDEVIKETMELLRPSLYDYKGNWSADYVRIRAHAIKK